MINVLKVHCNCCVYDTEKQTFWRRCVNNYRTPIPIVFFFFSLLNTKIAIGGNIKRNKIPFYFFSNIPKNRVGGSVNQFLKKKRPKDKSRIEVSVAIFDYLCLVISKDISIIKIIHRYSGRLIYIFRKVLVLNYLYNYVSQKYTFSPYIVIVALICFLLFTHILIYFLIRGKKFDEKNHKFSYLIDHGSNSQKYVDLLKNFNANLLNTSLTEAETLRITVEDMNLESELID